MCDAARTCSARTATLALDAPDSAPPLQRAYTCGYTAHRASEATGESDCVEHREHYGATTCRCSETRRHLAYVLHLAVSDRSLQVPFRGLIPGM